MAKRSMGEALRYAAAVDDALVRPSRISIPRSRLRNALTSVPFQYFLVAAIAAFFCLYKVGAWSFADGDQTTHSKVVQEMVYSGDWFHPTNQGKWYYNKPPFKMWIAAAIVAVFGESNATYQVLDGVIGVAIALLLFWFARRLFESSSAGWFTVLALMSCRLFFWGHGVRQAVQDGMLLFLSILGVIAGWKIVATLANYRERIPPAELGTPRREIFKWSLICGITTGCAILTKSAAGLITPIILFPVFLFTGQLWRYLKEHWRSALAAIFWTLFIPALYYVPTLISKPRLYYLIVRHEVLKRATVGYHNQHNPLFYLYAIFDDKLCVPPLLLLAGLTTAFLALRRRDLRAVLLLSWAIVPVAFYSALHSRLEWYILPAVPAMCLLVGWFASNISTIFWMEFTAPRYFARRRFDRFSISAAALVFIILLLGVQIFPLVQKLLETPVRSSTDLLVSQVRNRIDAPTHRPLALRFDLPKISRDEAFYWSMLGLKKVSSEDELLQELDTGKYSFVLTHPRHLKRIAAHKPFKHYLLVRPRSVRKTWLAVLNFDDLGAGPVMEPVRAVTKFSDHGFVDAFGLSFRQGFGDKFIRTTLSDEFGFIVNADMVRSLLPSRLTIHAASNVSSSEGGLKVEFFINRRSVGHVDFVGKGFVDLSLNLQPGVWQRGRNLISGVITRNDGAPLKKDFAALMIQAVTVDSSL